MRAKDDFGKKTGRRSNPEEEEKQPARVYRPRTAKLSTWQPKEVNEEEAAEKKVVEKVQKLKPVFDEEPTERPKKLKFGGDKETKKETSSRPKRKEDKAESSTPKKRILTRKESNDSDNPKSRKTLGEKKTFSRSDEYGSGSRSRGKSIRSDKNERVTERREYYKDTYGKKKGGEFQSERSFEKKDLRKKTYKSSYNEDEAFEREDRKKIVRKPPMIESELKTDKEGLIRLNKYISHSGLCSRREADEYIVNGLITVNGIVIKELGTKIKPTDEVQFKGKGLDPERKVYILLNKPKDYITTVEDPHAKRTVMDLIQGACEQRVYPVGRLDRNSTGLLLLTNDGELTKKLTHPSFMKKKVYEVGLDRVVSSEDMKIIASGVELDGEMVHADAIEYIDPKDKSQVGIEIHSGQNRVVRRIFEKLNYHVQKLDRVYFAGLTKKNLPRGKWRFLSQQEVTMLMTNRF